MAEKFFIIDLMPFLYKGHFVFLRNPRMTSTGLNTSALIGFANGVTSILADYKPGYAVLAMDPGGPTFRHEAFPAYKAQREKMPEDLAANVPYAFELAEALRLPVVRKDGFEADDVMGTLAVKAAAAGFDVYLATPDKDAAQLVAPNIRLFRPGHGKEGPAIYDAEAVKEHWGLASPRQMVDLLALAGDAADNIPGIRGVGEKTALSLLAQYGTVEGILEHAGELKGKLAEKVAAGAEDARISKFLTTIRTDVPLDVDFESFRRVAPDEGKLAAVCARFELTQLARRLGVGGGMAASALPDANYRRLADVPHDYRLVSTDAEARELARILEAAPRFAFDTETTGIDARTVELVGLSFATEPGKAWYVVVPRQPAAVQSSLFGDDLFVGGSSAASIRPTGDPNARVGIFAKAFADPAKILIAQNAKYDMTVLSRYGIVFGSTVHDTMLEHYVMDAAARHGLDALAREYLRYDPIHYEDVVGEKKRGEPQLTMGDIEPGKILDYAAEDADVALRLDAILRPRALEIAPRALEESEEPLVAILSEMERAGVQIDVAALRQYGTELDREIVGLAAEIKAVAGAEINLDSPRQLGRFLFGKLGLEPEGVKKTQTGQFSTDEKTLVKLLDAHPVVQKVLDYRACTKLKSTYVDKLPLCIDPHDGRVHTTFSQALTETGRLSSAEPNLQNIPIRTERGRFIRAAIMARDGNHRLVSADYSQIELRLMAAMSGDESMRAAFARGADIHRETAARVYGVSPELVTPEMRSRCKMVNFGIIYGISAFGLAQRLHCPRKEAAELIDSYFRLYPRIRAFMDSAIARARETGYAATALGRRRTLRDINSRNATVRQSAERDAINTPIQGTAADLIKLAMVKVDRALKRAGLNAQMILQIHDELLFDVPVEEVDRVRDIVTREMEQAMDFGVPLEVSVGAGRNWLEAH
ncbi:MAG: DNA polymerase I [Kiritimatiellia bacterium]